MEELEAKLADREHRLMMSILELRGRYDLRDQFARLESMVIGWAGIKWEIDKKKRKMKKRRKRKVPKTWRRPFPQLVACRSARVDMRIRRQERGFALALRGSGARLLFWQSLVRCRAVRLRSTVMSISLGDCFRSGFHILLFGLTVDTRCVSLQRAAEPASGPRCRWQFCGILLGLFHEKQFLFIVDAKEF